MGPDGTARHAILPLVLLVALLGASIWLALSLDPLSEPPARLRTVGAVTTIRDLLTGRFVDENGVPMPPESGPGSLASPLQVRFVPSTDVGQSAAAVDRLLDFLELRTGYAIEGATLMNYGLVVQEIVIGECDVAFLTATSYARARYATENNTNPDDGIEAIVQVVRQGSPDHPGSDLAYRSALIVRTESALTSARELTDEHVVAMGNITSGASSLLPSAFFRQLGVTPHVQRYEGYPTIINAVLQGAVDVGCIWWSPPNGERPHNDARQLVLAMDPEVIEKTRIFDMSPWIPNEPVVVRSALPDDLKRIVARALTLYAALRTLTKEGRDELVGVGGPVGFIPATNEDFVPLMELVEQAFADDPEGRRDFMRGSK